MAHADSSADAKLIHDATTIVNIPDIETNASGWHKEWEKDSAFLRALNTLGKVCAVSKT